MIAAGTLRTRVVVEQITSEPRNSFGEAVPVWGTFASRYGRVEPQSGREFLAAQQIVPELTHLVTLRYLAGLVPKMRLRIGARTLNVLAVLDTEEQHTEMRCLCRELPDG